jgi:hypothetical protein
MEGICYDRNGKNAKTNRGPRGTIDKIKKEVTYVVDNIIREMIL